METQPLVSIFLPTHNRFCSGFLRRAIESVLEQTYENFEFFIIDDASNDGTEEYLNSLQDKRITVIRHEQNVGLPAITLADAYLKSRGRFLAFIFDDNELAPIHLSTLVQASSSNPTKDMIYGQTILLENGKEILLGRKFDLKLLQEANYIGNSAVLLKRAVIEQVGFYDPHIVVKRVCDWDLWLRIGKNAQVHYVPEVIAFEYGRSLPDSLGSSVSYCDSLIRKYFQSQRNHALSPKSIANREISIARVPEFLNKEEKEYLAFLVFEHYLRTKDMEQLISHSKIWLDQGNLSSEQLLVNAFNKYLSNLSRAYVLDTQLEMLKQEHELLGKDHSNLSMKHNQILGSSSWKLTRPIREFSKLIKQLVGALFHSHY